MDNNSIKKSFKQNFTIVQNEIIEDKRITWNAKGLYTYLTSRPENWKFNQNDLINRSKDGSSKVKSTIKELKENGYLEIKQIRDKKGIIKSWEWTIYDYEQAINRTIYPQVENPLVDKPLMDKPLVDNAPNNNTNNTNTDFNNTKREKEINDNFSISDNEIEEYISKQLKNNKRIMNEEGYRVTIFNKIKKGDKRTLNGLKRFIENYNQEKNKNNFKAKIESLNDSFRLKKIEVNHNIFEIKEISRASEEDIKKVGNVEAVLKAENLINKTISIFPIVNIENVEKFVNEHKITG